MSARERHATAGRSKLALAVGSLGIGLLLLLALEGGLRLVGIGAAEQAGSRLRYQQIHGPVLRPAELPDGTPVLATADPRLSFQTVLRDKPADALRVFVFGGSATAGLGFSPNVTFARELERMLVRALPERRIELVNLGIVAFSSYQVRELVAEVARSCAPDLMIVYSGNNEFLELHAEKYDEHHASFGSKVRGLLLDTNLVRALRGMRGRRPAPLGVSQATEEEVRLSEATLIRDIEVTEQEVADVLDAYEANMEAMVAEASEHGVPILLMAVASNWRWRGRSDLPAGWVEELAGRAGPVTDELRRAALSAVEARLPGAGRDERHELLYRRAVLRDELADPDGARADFRAAMNADPHLRRALDAANERVARVARARGVPYLDTVSSLASEAREGIVGFDEFYDYVHFSPRGAVLVAEALLRAMQAAGVVPAEVPFDPGEHARERIGTLAALVEDSLAVGDWLGFCFDRGRIADRDLWKYDQALADLDARLEREPADFRALVYRGNARSFRLDGAAGAAADYRAALHEQPDDATVQANLRALLARRKVDG